MLDSRLAELWRAGNSSLSTVDMLDHETILMTLSVAAVQDAGC